MSYRFVVLRLLQALFSVFAILVITFVLVQAAPGDAADALAPETGDIAAAKAQLRVELGLDRPLLEQFARYASRTLRGDLGVSFVENGRTVVDVIGGYIEPTLLLMGTALSVSSVGGVVLGTMAARRPRAGLDSAMSTAALVAYSVPAFWLGTLAALTFGFRIRLFPLGGMTSARAATSGPSHLLDIAWHLVLPGLVLAASELALVFRLIRAGLLQEVQRQYVWMARAKGVPEDKVLFRHALRNALLPVVTVLGTRLALVFSGAVAVEAVFAWPGLGSLLVTSARDRDRPVVMGAMVLIAFGLVVANLLTDLLYAWIDPRTRHG